MSPHPTEADIERIVRERIAEHHAECCGSLATVRRDIRNVWGRLNAVNDQLQFIRGQFSVWQRLTPAERVGVGAGAASGWVTMLVYAVLTGKLPHG